MKYIASLVVEKEIVEMPVSDSEHVAESGAESRTARVSLLEGEPGGRIGTRTPEFPSHVIRKGFHILTSNYVNKPVLH